MAKFLFYYNRHIFICIEGFKKNDIIKFVLLFFFIRTLFFSRLRLFNHFNYLLRTEYGFYFSITKYENCIKLTKKLN